MTLALGIDPGTATTGYGLVRLMRDGELVAVSYGIITTPKDATASARLEMLFDQLNDLIKANKPDTAAVEKLFFQSNVKTALAVGQARGVIMLVARRRGIGVQEFAANRIKQSLTGHGHASKTQMQRAVQRQWNLASPPDPPDVADALAVALCCGQQLGRIVEGRK